MRTGQGIAARSICVSHKSTHLLLAVGRRERRLPNTLRPRVLSLRTCQWEDRTFPDSHGGSRNSHNQLA